MHTHTKTPSFCASVVQINTSLLTFAEVCSALRRSRATIYKMMAKDSTFPRPIKDGDSRQARAYFDAGELQTWIEQQKNKRGV